MRSSADVVDARVSAVKNASLLLTHSPALQQTLRNLSIFEMDVISSLASIFTTGRLVR